MAKKEIFDTSDLVSQSKAIYTALSSESEIASVLIATSFLDTTLEALLQHNFIKSRVSKSMLDSNTGVLGSFSAKCDLAYCSGIIPKNTYKDLKSLGEIRNIFAHNHLQTNFTNPKVKDICSKLLQPKETIKDFGASSGNNSIKRYYENPRNCFIVTVAILCNVLILKELSLKRKKYESDNIKNV